MKLFPAIDVKGGRVVRLSQGDYDRVQVYGEDPVAVARDFRRRGAKNLHVVDLDGARDGRLVNFDTIRRVVEDGGLFLQIGGGIRDEERIRRYLELGVGRVILGTAAVEDEDFLQRMVDAYGEKIAVGVDARDGKVAVKGWREVVDLDSVAFCQKLERMGVKTMIYTDIARDGMGFGTNLEVYRELAGQIGCDLIASGGISSLGEIEELGAMGLYGAIVGKALYSGVMTLEEVLSVC